MTQCTPEGVGDVGAKCTTGADCLAGLGCNLGSCAPYPPVPEGGPPIALPSWFGETCSDPTGATQAYFRVPRGTDDGDFYRLPFPNDVRNDAGKISLAGHPTPGSGLLGYDLVDRWLRDLEATVDGFSTYPSVYFRFSATVDIGGTLKMDGAVRFVDITHPQTPVDLGFNWNATTGRNAYICNNWMAVRPPRGQPLTPGHTYAVILSTVVLDANLKPIQVPPDLAALLAATSPSDATLAAQWPKYQPLRDWAGAAGVSVGTILDATVFTVGHPSAIGAPLAAAIAAATPAPAATGWIRCGDAPSPCPQATGTRGCGTPDPTFDELHALVTLPIFQKGTEPYATPADGGAFVLDTAGTPQVQRTEQVCLALTVPKGVTMPAGGWPLVVYAHGTGGSFRSHVSEGVAARLASVDDGAGGHVNIAVLGIDQVEHGTRRGTSQESPDTLFYNFVNPLAARGNTLQGAADQLSLLRFATSLDLPAAQSPTNAEIKFGSFAFWGHSQGASEGGLAMPYAAAGPGGVRGAVLSGEGASLMDALLTKKNPVDIADALPAVLEDPQVDGNHPILSLLQGDLGVVDPLNYGALFFVSPVAPANVKHVLQPYGQNDSYSPPVTELTFAEVTQLAEAAPPSGVTGAPLFGTTPLAVPSGGVGGNAMVGGMPFTAIVRQYAPASTYDGHFVAFQNAAAEADVDHFLADVLAGKVPAVGR
jgi:pimeloyl-ACP methyl ester carboxylesterase